MAAVSYQRVLVEVSRENHLQSSNPMDFLFTSKLRIFLENSRIELSIHQQRWPGVLVALCCHTDSFDTLPAHHRGNSNDHRFQTVLDHTVQLSWSIAISHDNLDRDYESFSRVYTERDLAKESLHFHIRSLGFQGRIGLAQTVWWFVILRDSDH